jgi:hypothetical protein
MGKMLTLNNIEEFTIFNGVCLYARFQSCPKESHLVALKRIISIFTWHNRSRFMVF